MCRAPGRARRGLDRPPILPGLSDQPSQLAEVVKAARDAGACGIWANLLYLRPGTREHFLDSLARGWPEEVDRYAPLYENGRAYLRAEHTKPIRAAVAKLAKEHGVRDRRRVRLDPEPPVIAEQLALAV